MIDLVARAQHGDADAFGLLVAGLTDRLYATAYLVLRDRALAEDAVQEGLVRTWTELPRLRDHERFEAWTRRIVLRQALDEARRLRSRPRLAALDADGALADGGHEHIGVRDWLDRALATLTAEHRAVLVLRHYLGLSVPEVAGALDLPLGTAKSRLHHATQAMRAALDADARADARRHTA
jgi:RNA polymerase sigma-70 factor (ECF subfamily)